MIPVLEYFNQVFRSQTFYQIFSFKLITDMVAPQIASTAMKHSLWLPYLLCGLFLFLILPLIALMPETLLLGEEITKLDAYSNNDQHNPISVYRGFFTEWRVVIGLIVIFLIQFRYSTIQIVLPYISMRFEWSISDVSSARNPFDA